jgi:dTDP-4-amino-4,6-dideoxygalactose transaminase
MLVVEDCAQSLRGPHDRGDELADVSLFSFGAIKTATALGGALARVGDERLAERMKVRQEGWPVQPRRQFALRALKFAGLRALGQPRVYWSFSRLLAAAGRDLDDVVNGSVRGFPRGELLRQIRRRPSAPLLALLARRLSRFDTARIEARAQAGRRVAAALPGDVVQPGRAAPDGTNWVFPVVTNHREKLVATLRRAGFDAAVATSGIASVAAPPDRLDLSPELADRTMAEIVFLPAYPELGDRELARLASVVEWTADAAR